MTPLLEFVGWLMVAFIGLGCVASWLVLMRSVKTRSIRPVVMPSTSFRSLVHEPESNAAATTNPAPAY